MEKLQYLKGQIVSFSIITALLFLISCEDKSFENPYDQNVDIDTLAPYDLEVEHISIMEKKIKWKCDVENPVQFLIDKRVDDGKWIEVFKSKLEYPFEWTDSAIELNKTHHYRIKAKFDERVSSEANFSINGDIPEPLDFKVEKINDISNKIKWGYDIPGIQGFRIDRKKNYEDWKINYGELAANQTEFIDTNVFFNPDKNTILEYRIYAFYENHESTKALATSNVELPAPANPEIIENSLTSVTILWQDISDGEDGFRVERKYDGGSWHEIAETQNNSIVDSDFELNTEVYYRLSSYYNEHSSYFALVNFDASVPAPENFEITKNSLSSVTLNWNYNHIGHGSFKIDRKMDDGSWEMEYIIVDAEANTVMDEVDLENHYYAYRITALVNDYQSVPVEREAISFFTDPRDGQTYEIVDIGDQIWFAENLNYSTEYSYYYNDSPDNGDIYGRLYQFVAATEACPDGWHLPSDEEWKVLEMELGMSQSEVDEVDGRGTDQGEKLKSTSGWFDTGSGDFNGTNSSGFNALPGGFMSGEDFIYLGGVALWWTNTENSDLQIWYRGLSNVDHQVQRRDLETDDDAFSVRCLRD